MHQRPTSTRVAAGLALLALAVAGCSTATSAQPTAPSSPPVATASPTSSPSPTPEQQAVSDAETILHAYSRATDELFFNPATTSPDSFKATTISSELVNQQNALLYAKTQNLRQAGYQTVLWVHPLSVSLAMDLSKTPPDVPTVQFDVCYDVSQVDIVNAQGVSVVPPSRVSRGVERVGVADYSYPDPTMWRVAWTQMQKGTPC